MTEVSNPNEPEQKEIIESLKEVEKQPQTELTTDGETKDQKELKDQAEPEKPKPKPKPKKVDPPSEEEEEEEEDESEEFDAEDERVARSELHVQK